MKKLTPWVLLALLIPCLSAYIRSTAATNTSCTPAAASNNHYQVQKAIGGANASVHGFTGNDSFAGDTRF